MSSAAVTEGEILSHAIETIGDSHWHQVAHVLSKLALPERDLDGVDQLLKKAAPRQSRMVNVPNSISIFVSEIS